MATEKVRVEFCAADTEEVNEDDVDKSPAEIDEIDDFDESSDDQRRR